MEVEGVIGVGAERGLDTSRSSARSASTATNPRCARWCSASIARAAWSRPPRRSSPRSRRLREAKKPVVASLGSVAASGGYYVAVAADRIFANPGTLTGSIGVVMQLANVEGLLKKVGVEYVVVKAGAYKDVGNFARAMTPEERRDPPGAARRRLRPVHRRGGRGARARPQAVRALRRGARSTRAGRPRASRWWTSWAASRTPSRRPAKMAGTAGEAQGDLPAAALLAARAAARTSSGSAARSRACLPSLADPPAHRST